MVPFHNSAIGWISFKYGNLLFIVFFVKKNDRLVGVASQ